MLRVFKFNAKVQGKTSGIGMTMTTHYRGTSTIEKDDIPEEKIKAELQEVIMNWFKKDFPTLKDHAIIKVTWKMETGYERTNEKSANRELPKLRR